MAGVTLRRAVLADAREIASVHRVSRADYYGVPPEADDDREAMWAHFLVQQGRVTHVAQASGAVVGFMSALHLTDPAIEVKLTALYVLPTHYGQGIGSLLHDTFLEGRGHDEPGVLEVWAANRRAVGFYERRGWLATATTRPGPQDVAFVTYRLPVVVTAGAGRAGTRRSRPAAPPRRRSRRRGHNDGRCRV